MQIITLLVMAAIAFNQGMSLYSRVAFKVVLRSLSYIIVMAALATDLELYNVSSRDGLVHSCE